MYVYTHTHIYIYIAILCMCVYDRNTVCVRVSAYIHLHTRICMYTYLYMYTSKHTRPQTTHRCIHIFTCTYMRLYTHTHIQYCDRFYFRGVLGVPHPDGRDPNVVRRPLYYWPLPLQRLCDPPPPLPSHASLLFVVREPNQSMYANPHEQIPPPPSAPPTPPLPHPPSLCLSLTHTPCMLTDIQCGVLV